METELTLSCGGFPPFSARGCVQELTPISLGNFRRTINNELIYLGKSEKKYRSVITCQDKTSFATDGLMPGSLITIDCLQRLWQKIEKNNIELERTPVKGSVVAVDSSQNFINIIDISDRLIKIDGDQGYISYRPTLTMRVIHYTLTTDEWGAKVGWRLEVEEV